MDVKDENLHKRKTRDKEHDCQKKPVTRLSRTAIEIEEQNQRKRETRDEEHECQ
jgi:hypothetical protein